MYIYELSVMRDSAVRFGCEKIRLSKVESSVKFDKLERN